MRNIVFPLILIGIFAIMGLAVWYLARRTAFIFGTRANWWYVAYSITLVSSLVFMFLASQPWTLNPIGHFCSIASSVMVGILLYLLMVMILVDWVQWFAHLPHWLFGTVVGTLTLIVCGYATYNASNTKLVEVKVQLPKLQQNIRIVQLTDTHIGHFRGKEHVQKLVSLVNKANPDIIFFTGDCFESWYNFNAQTLEPLAQLQAPIYFVEGNHDGYVNSKQAKQLLREAGVHVLENEVATDKGLCIVGLEYMSADTKSVNAHAPHRSETIESILPSLPIDKTLPVIALQHSPIGTNYIEKAGIDLLLSGHTHGGQLWPLTWINNRAFRYNKGLSKQNTLQIYTSCGSGSFGPPMRLGTPSEIAVLDLETAPEKNNHN